MALKGARGVAMRALAGQSVANAGASARAGVLTRARARAARDAGVEAAGVMVAPCPSVHTDGTVLPPVVPPLVHVDPACIEWMLEGVTRRRWRDAEQVYCNVEWFSVEEEEEEEEEEEGEEDEEEEGEEE